MIILIRGRRSSATNRRDHRRRGFPACDWSQSLHGVYPPEVFFRHVQPRVPKRGFPIMAVRSALERRIHEANMRRAEFDRVLDFLDGIGVRFSIKDREDGRYDAIFRKGHTMARLADLYAKGDEDG